MSLWTACIGSARARICVAYVRGVRDASCVAVMLKVLAGKEPSRYSCGKLPGVFRWDSVVVSPQREGQKTNSKNFDVAGNGRQESLFSASKRCASGDSIFPTLPEAACKRRQGSMEDFLR